MLQREWRPCTLLAAALVVGCSDIRHLRRAAEGVAAVVPAQEVTATLKGRGQLVVTIVNSPLGRSPDSVVRKVSEELAIQVSSQYDGDGPIASVTISFRERASVGPVGAPTGVASYVFTMAPIDTLAAYDTRK